SARQPVMPDHDDAMDLGQHGGDASHGDQRERGEADREGGERVHARLNQAISTLTDAKPSSTGMSGQRSSAIAPTETARKPTKRSTRLNSSHGSISYAVFCL